MPAPMPVCLETFAKLSSKICLFVPIVRLCVWAWGPEYCRFSSSFFEDECAFSHDVDTALLFLTGYVQWKEQQCPVSL
jgi:hypothetical protein